MLIIRREQMEALSRASMKRFEKDLVADLRRAHPADFGRLGEPAVLQLVRGAVKRGALYGITAERDIATMAELDLILGAPFEQQKGYDWAHLLLRNVSITPTGRLAVIMARLPAE
jgi:hypothetical protein